LQLLPMALRFLLNFISKQDLHIITEYYRCTM